MSQEKHSSVMSLSEAREIASAFGTLVAEITDTKNYSFDDHRKGLAYSFPIDRLRHPKVQIQTALAVVIAELTAELATRPTEQAKAFLTAALGCSGEVQYFSRKPLLNKGGDDSIYIYGGWVKRCEQCFAAVAGDLGEYRRMVDRLMPDLLSDPVLAKARET
jgi:hypothetical protein